MKIFLKYLVPASALIVFGLCFWLFIGSYFYHFGSAPYAEPQTPYQKGLNIFLFDTLPIYFLAKGIFCSLMLFLFGKFFESWLDKK